MLRNNSPFLPGSSSWRNMLNRAGQSGRARGIIYAVIGTMFWGFSGAAAQYAFGDLHLNPLWLVGVRLFGAGALLLLWFGLQQPRALLKLWTSPKRAILMVVFALLGMIPSQLTYFMAIQYGNAATATVLQFTGPLFIVVYLACANRQWPRRVDMFAIALAMLGTVLVVTHGHLTSLALAPLAVVWGLAAGVSQASYTLLPRTLLAQFDARLVVGWAMLVGSVPFAPLLIKTGVPVLPVSGWLTIAFIVIVGTMFAYLLYLKSMAYITPTATGMLSAFEPLTATVMTVILLGTRIGPAEIIGGLMILGTVFLQALPMRRRGQLRGL